MNDQKIKTLLDNLLNLKSAKINVLNETTDKEAYELVDELNAAIKPVLDKWIEITEKRIRDAVAEE